MTHSQINNTDSVSANTEQWLAHVGTLYENHQTQMREVLEAAGTVKKTATVAGFTIAVADDEATHLFKKKIIEEAEHGKLLKLKMNAAGITPIAILPEDIFNKIIAKAGFYSFYRVQADGRVYGNGKNYQKAKNLGGKVLGPFFVAMIICLIGFIFLPLSSSVYWKTVGISFSVSLLLFYKINIGLDTASEKFFAKVIVSLFFGFSPLSLPTLIVLGIIKAIVIRTKTNWEKQKLWPMKNDVEDVTEDLFTLQLPEPPARTKGLLAKCYKHNIQTFLTLDPKAFRVILDRETKKALYAKYDPVICTRENKMVAVLDQFGDFPDEQKVIDYIAEHFNAMRQDLLPGQVN